MRRAREACVPARVRAALASIFGDEVDQVHVIEHAWRVRLHGRAVATTRRAHIYLRGSAEDFFADPSLMLHEYCHVVRQWQPGTLTVPRYLMECLRRGYWNNRFEIEARAFAAFHVERLHTLLCAPSAQERLALVQPAGNGHQERCDQERGHDRD